MSGYQRRFGFGKRRGQSAEDPLTLGAENGAEPIEVEATGLYLNVRKGSRVWVTGDAVQDGIERMILIPIGVPLTVDADGRFTVVQSDSPEPPGPSAPLTPLYDLTAANPDGDDPDPDDDIVEFDPAEHTVPEVLAFIEENPDLAADVLEAERAGKARAGILKAFES